MPHVPGNPRIFPTTQWSQIELAGDENAQGKRPALEELLRRYLPAMRAQLLARGQVKSDQVEDLLQGFISGKLLSRGLLGRARRGRGKFRTFLLTALDRFIVSQRRREQAIKRGADRTQRLATGEEFAQVPQRADAFDVAWAREIIRQTLSRTRAQLEAEGRLDVWGVLQSRVLGPTLRGERPGDYDEMIRRFAYRSPSQLWNAVRSGKQRFARVLREVIGEYVDSPEQAEAELRDLKQICATTVQGPPPSAYP